MQNKFTIATRVAIAADIDQILALQSANLLANLSKYLSESELADGFVTTPFTPDQIEFLMSETGAFVAETDGKIVGYLFAGSWDFFSQWQIFPLMVSRFPNLSFLGKSITAENSFQYGPVCIDRALRGSGIFLQLFETMRSSFAERFPIGITFINQKNLRSFNAHTKKLNLEILDRFEFNRNSFHLLAFSTQKITESERTLQIH